MQRSAAVVNTGFDKVGEHIICIGRAHQLTNGQAQLLCQPAGQNITKVTGGDTEVHGIAHFDLTPAQEVRVGLEIICNLRGKSADIDGVCGGQAQAVTVGESAVLCT